MTHATTTRAIGTRSFLPGLRAFAGDLRASLARHREFDRTYRELAALSERELADIGLARGDIVDVAWQAAERA